MGKGDECIDACRGQSAAPDNGREGEGSCWPQLAAPHLGVEEKAKAFHVSADVQLEEDSKSEGKAEGTDFPALSRVHARSYARWGGGDAAFPDHATIYFFPHPQPPSLG